MWKGRFKEEQSDLLKSYGASVHVDWQLYRQDIRGSIAHARALLGAGILTPEEFGQIEAGLLKKLDKSQIPNYKNLDASLMSKLTSVDPGNDYVLPWA